MKNQIICIATTTLALTVGMVQAIARDNFESREFQAQYFGKLGGILLPVPGPMDVGNVIFSRDFSVHRKFSECLVQPGHPTNFSDRFQDESIWDSTSNTLTGSTKVRVGRIRGELSFERSDTLEESDQNPLNVISEQLSISNHGVNTHILEECRDWYKRSNKTPASEWPDHFVVDKIMTWEGEATHTASLTIVGDASVTFKVSDVLPFLDALPWVSEILSRLELDAAIGGGQTKSSSARVSHNVSKTASSMKFIAFRPRFYDRSQQKDFMELIDKIRADYYAATSSGEQAAIFLEENKDFSMRDGILFALMFPGSGERRAFSEDVQLVSVDFAEGELTPEFFEEVSRLVEINELAGHILRR